MIEIDDLKVKDSKQVIGGIYPSRHVVDPGEGDPVFPGAPEVFPGAAE